MHCCSKMMLELISFSQQLIRIPFSSPLAACSLPALIVTLLCGFFDPFSSCELKAQQQQAKKVAARSVWANWRGPTQNGIAAPGVNPPVRWSEKKNVKWKVPLAGLGHSTPAVWGNHIFVTSAESFGNGFAPLPETAPGAHDNRQVTHRYRFQVTALDRRSGRVLWNKEVNRRIPHEGGHFTGSLASSSPVTDGKRVYAFFGSHGLYCLDYAGNLVWKRDFGLMSSKHAHGEGSSPVLQDNTLVINWDHQGQSFVTALDAKNGETLWKVNRDEVTSWSSPITALVEGRYQVIVPGSDRVRGYALDDGRVIWECGGLSNNVVASPVFEKGVVYVGSSYDSQAFLAIRVAGARGDISGSEHVLWFRRRHTPYVPSPLIYDDTLYFFRHYQGILYRVEASTGREKDARRLLGITNIYSSPIAAANRIYIVDRGGRTQVLQHAAEPEPLALNRLNDSFSASPVAVDDELILRGEEFLYCLKSEDTKD
ncbi:MAG: PQQ-binding-like beta-propeller repeat protein [Planctomycetota bacterium]|nr:PQQ-binding-like beta-propeller repeat protein [Planctomycetota bacterium]